MPSPSVTTFFDLTSQVLAGPNAFELLVYDPDVSLEEQVITALERKGECSMVDVAYGKTTIPVHLGLASQCVPQFNEFFLINTLERAGFTFERLANFYCQGGFSGIYFSRQPRTIQVYFIDTSKEAARLAMRWYGYDAERDQTLITCRAKEIERGWKAEYKGVQMQFVAKPLDEVVKADSRLIDFITCAQYVPGLSEGVPAFELGALEARKRQGRLFFTYSSLCDSLVRETGRRLHVNPHVLASREKPFVMDSIKGPMELAKTGLIEKWKPLGLIDYGKHAGYQYGHFWRVGLMSWE